MTFYYVLFYSVCIFLFELKNCFWILFSYMCLNCFFQLLRKKFVKKNDPSLAFSLPRAFPAAPSPALPQLRAPPHRTLSY